MKYDELYDMLSNIQMDIYQKMKNEPDNTDLQELHRSIVDAVWNLQKWKGLI